MSFCFNFLKCPCVKLSVFEFTHYFPVILPSFLYTHTHIHTRTHKTLSVIANVGAPEEEITWTQHTTHGSLHIFYTHTHTLAFLF